MSEAKSSALEGLRPSDFETFLERLDPDRDAAGQKYEGLRRKLIKFFEWNRCFPAEDLADQTLDRVARRLGREHVAQVHAFAWGVAHHVRQESGRQMRRRVGLRDLPAGRERRPEDDPEASLHERLLDERRERCLGTCLQRLPDRERELFRAYYAPGEGQDVRRLGLAVELGLTIRGLRVKVNRLREKLEECATRCLARPAPRYGSGPPEASAADPGSRRARSGRGGA